MFDTENYEKLEYADLMVDEIRGKYGIDSIKRAVFLGGPIDHMSGGISCEKRLVNYEKLKIENN